MIKAALAPTNKVVYYWCVTATGTEFYNKSQLSARDKGLHQIEVRSPGGTAGGIGEDCVPPS